MGITQNGWVYANTNENGLNHINNLAKSLNKKNSGKGCARLFLAEIVSGQSFGCVAPYVRVDGAQISGL